ncbi:hypothetical protein HNY73_023173 [Argiope bruennichi]|uniref:Uncharacterized protein n=1 Tax=Argiope bruennichi TaxID=94029 RepID=A0A8T0E4T8_ARGBR|nr:hypothetical protein HNY73_023173 [Argiope bruennichi]
MKKDCTTSEIYWRTTAKEPSPLLKASKFLRRYRWNVFFVKCPSGLLAAFIQGVCSARAHQKQIAHHLIRSVGSQKEAKEGFFAGNSRLSEELKKLLRERIKLGNEKARIIRPSDSTSEKEALWQNAPY